MHRHENERALSDKRVRNFQFFRINFNVFIQKDVDINNSRRIFERTKSAHCRLNTETRPEQSVRGQICFEHNAHIYKIILLYVPPRLCLIHRLNFYDRGVRQSQKRFERKRNVFLPIAYIRSNTQYRSHYLDLVILTLT